MNATKKAMKQMADKISAILPKGFGFVLLVFPFGESGIANYISNANRKDIITMLREAADRFEKQELTDIEKDHLYGTDDN